MKKRAFILFAMTAVLLAVSVLGGACAAAEAGNGPAVRTILFWAGGAAMEESEGGPVGKRLNKMMEEEIPDNLNIIVLTGGTDMGWLEELSLEGADSVRTDCNQVWKMKGAHDGQKGALVLLEADGLPGFEQQSMAEPATLKAFIDYGAANYPAEIYDLVLIQHGGGPAVGWGKDDVFPREDGKAMMSVDEICGALKESAVEHFDLLCFYACLMGSVEDAVMFSPYADTLVLSEENLNQAGIEFNGMLEMLREDTRTDSFALGRRLVDDTIGIFDGSNLTKNRIGTLAAISTKNLVERLLPEMTALTEILYREAAEPKENGEYAFYDELRSFAGSINFGNSFRLGYQLYDLGNAVTALGIAETELDSAPDVRELTNGYTETAVRIMKILNDRDGSGDDVLYSRDTESMHKAESNFYTRDAEGKLANDESGFLKTCGLSMFFDMEKTWYPVTFSSAVEGCAALGDLDEACVNYLKRYRDTVRLYALIQGSGRAVYELGGKEGLTVSDLMSAWEKLGIAVWDNAYTRGLFPDAGLKDIYEAVKASGFDVDPWLEKIAAQQAQEIMKAEEITVRRRESPEEQNAAGSYRLVSGKLSARQLNGLYMNVKIKADYPFNVVRGQDFQEDYVLFGVRHLAGSLSDDLLMPALFARENGGDFYRLVYGGQTALEIAPYDGYWYALKDAAGNTTIVQARRDPGDPDHVQVPVVFDLDAEKYGEMATCSGTLDFYFSGGDEAPAGSFVPMTNGYAFAEGSRPLTQEMFSGSSLQAVGILKPNAMTTYLGPEMAADESESRGYTLVRLPAKDIDVVKDVQAEYFLRDIYGNELVLTDKVSAADSEPLLKNLLFAEAKAENGEVTVTYGGEALDPDLDYMVYTKDGKTLVQGIGEYAGYLVLDDVK